MSHSKTTKRGRSQYIEKWNPSAKKYINICVLCGRKGYNPSIEEHGFIKDDMRLGSDLERKAIYSELTKTLKPLSLDNEGRCSDCANRMEK